MTAQEVTALWLRLLRGGYTPLPLYGKEPPVYGKNNPRKGLPGWQTLKNITPETGVLWDVTSDYDVPLMVSRGMPSLTVLHASAQAIRNADEQDRSTYTYQFGDYDPSGVLIPKTIERRLDEMCERLDCPPPLVERIALIEEQINKHRLPTRPTKRNGNPHTAGFVGRSVELELDTLPPRVLQDLVRKVIEQRISRRATLALRVAEHSEREMLRVISRDERRRADREVAAISAKHPGCCSLCGRAFIHGSVTFIGRTSDGAMQVVSECCSRKTARAARGRRLPRAGILRCGGVMTWPSPRPSPSCSRCACSSSTMDGMSFPARRAIRNATSSAGPASRPTSSISTVGRGHFRRTPIPLLWATGITSASTSTCCPILISRTAFRRSRSSISASRRSFASVSGQNGCSSTANARRLVSRAIAAAMRG